MLNPDDFRFPSIEALQAFEAAARLGTFERAAELLSITGSAASKRVSGLEGMLGVSLLQRANPPFGPRQVEHHLC
ncbi:LysR family transcriptional regulator, partial [Pseudomonas aeruginosa]|nr:LysR family transcriptional regulator [Pseudomonas aeruginosa]